MSSPSFRFKRFTVWHDRCAMRVGTDGVLLGAWAPVDGSRILDIGCGSGLIALMAAQRNPRAEIVGLDVDRDSVLQAQENVSASEFSSRIRILEQDVRTFQTAEKFDSILCNPPFYTEDILPPDENRMKARNAAALSFEALTRCAARLLSESGNFSVILPAHSAADFAALCLTQNLFLAARCDVKTVEHKPPKRALLTFSRTEICCVMPEVLVLQGADGERSQQYKNLTADFYL